MLAALGLFALVEAVGLAAAPLAALALGRLPGAGLGLSKVLGVLLVTWAVWLLASLHVAAYGVPLVAAVLGGLAVAGGLAARQRPAALRLDDSVRRKLLLGSEAVFAVAYAAMALLASFAPDVWGTEKPMDMAFINAVNASAHFPPHDPWMSGESLNYYYLGHLAMAWPARLLGLAPDAGYLLAWALLFALTAAAVFTVGGTLWAAARATMGERAPKAGPVAAGLLAVALCLVLGDLAGVREWIDAAHPPGDYDWFGVSRVIPGHDQRVPRVLVRARRPARARARAAVHAPGDRLRADRGAARPGRAGRAVGGAARLSIGALYAINSWSYPVAAGLLAAAW